MPIYKDKTRRKAIQKGLKDLGISKKEANIRMIRTHVLSPWGMVIKEVSVAITPLSAEEIKQANQRRVRFYLLIGLILVCLSLFILLFHLFTKS
ncbi:hypothetical protein [Streptococcus himalayensis]|uniref:Uncharacterized protein n=1 Tax=Streptococcus himalayensis TaxID=1888195 RepID=A0A917A623_9STRE|nr:hypothetical protein [Streptococcus himalayensis]GGE30328.1 hypothetical protein GCM10011510_09440 [Streptococcus himalayensis]